MIPNLTRDNTFNLQKEFESHNEYNQVQITLSSNIIKIPISNLLNFSALLQQECLYSDAGNFFSHKLQLFSKEFNIKESSILTFLIMLQGRDFTVVNEQFCDLSKLSYLFKIDLLQKFLEKYANNHSNDIDFNINLILERMSIEKDCIFGQDNLSTKAEAFLCKNIDECIVTDVFWKLPISVIYRIIEKSNSKKITSDFLCEFILKSIKDRHVLFSLIKIGDISDNKFSEIYNCYMTNKDTKLFDYISVNLSYIKALKDNKKELEYKVKESIETQQNLNEQLIKITNEKENLQSELNEINTEKNQIQLQFEQIKNEKEKIEEDFKCLLEEKEELCKKNKNIILENELIQAKNKIMEKNNAQLIKQTDSIYYDFVNALLLMDENVNKIKLSEILLL